MDYDVLASRRRFLRQTLLALAAAGVGGPLVSRAARAAIRPASLGATSPIATIGDDEASSKDFNGDEFDRAHEILWDKEGYLRKLGAFPPIEERVGVAVVGGGVSGLLSAYRLREHRPVLLEQSSRVGGNSKGEAWGNCEYSIGAAYLSQPEDDAPLVSLLDELGLGKSYRLETGAEGAAYQAGKLHHGFWDGATDPARADEFKRVMATMAKVYEDAYPDVPPKGADSALTRDQLNRLDSMTFQQWAAANLGTLHPHIDEFFQLYLWSSFAGTHAQISAAQALSFLSADLHGTIALPGGNAAIARELHRRVVDASGAERVRTGTLVIDVAPYEDGVRVLYEGADRKPRCLFAKRCVVAAPKFAAQFVVSGQPDAQRAAMRKLTYNGYVVANVLLKKNLASPSYELFNLTGTPPTYRVRDELKTRGFTDLCFGSWAAHDRPDRSVLTLYRALPFQGARQFLYSPFAHENHKNAIEPVLPGVLKSIGLTESDVAGMRLTRWGHALPVASAGLIADGTLETASAPVAGRIYFAQQDNWANPCFETALQTSTLAADSVKLGL